MLMFDHFDSICALFLGQLEEFLHVPCARWPGLKELSVFVAWHSLLLLPSGAIQFTPSVYLMLRWSVVLFLWALSIFSPRSPLEGTARSVRARGPPTLRGMACLSRARRCPLHWGPRYALCDAFFMQHVHARVRVFVYGVWVFARACVFEALWVRDGFGVAFSIHLLAPG